MRWIPLLILTYVVVLLETTVGRALFINTASLGSVGPDLTALVVVFVAFYARSATDAMIAAWILGFAVDLTVGGAMGAMTVVGPMSIAYCLVAGLLWRVRDAFFRERAVTQALLALAFCALAHGAWVTAQAMLAPGPAAFGDYGRTLGQALAGACYTALLMPLAHYGLSKCQRMFFVSAVGPTRRMRR
ncbi:MAG: rod shape-determining protein MreD [Phycisphaerae bacterium]|nr:rod shape-determining protein MreD [Phycisphaerae bacterium]